LYPLSILINPRLLYGSRGFWISKNGPAKITQLINALTISRQKVQIDNHINDILGHSLQLLQESNHQSSVVNLPNFSADKKYFDESQAAHLKKTLDTIITVNKIYLVKQLDIKDLASAMSVHHNYLQAFISQYIGLSFSDFIDSYRIKAFIDHYTSSELKSIHESAIASGFDNENNMMEAFKKITGTNPDLYFTK
jgi:YesN/AraC family two-component response regulator